MIRPDFFAPFWIADRLGEVVLLVAFLGFAAFGVRSAWRAWR